MLGRYYISTGLLDPKFARTLSELKSLRIACDYDGFEPGEELLLPYFNDVELVIDTVERLVAGQAGTP